MRLIEKKIRDEIENIKKLSKNQNCGDGFENNCNLQISALEWVLSELQKESDLMQEMLETLETQVNHDLELGWGYNKKRLDYQINLIQKVKQEMSIDK